MQCGYSWLRRQAWTRQHAVGTHLSKPEELDDIEEQLSLASTSVDKRLGVDEIAPTQRRFSVGLASMS
eukprot:1270261-Pyramimonas_sp.AAC.1